MARVLTMFIFAVLKNSGLLYIAFDRCCQVIVERNCFSCGRQCSFLMNAG